MKIKLLFIAAITAALLCQCSEDGSEIPILPEGVNDIVDGKLFHFIDVDELNENLLELKTLAEVELTSDNDSYSFENRIINGTQYVVPVINGTQEEGYQIVKLKITPKGHSEYARNLMLVFRKKQDDTKSEPLLSCYSEYIGKGTRCYEDISNTTYPVLKYEYIEQLDENYLTVNSTLNSLKMMEYSGYDYQSTMESWAFDVGASFQHTRPAKFKPLSDSDLDLVLDIAGGNADLLGDLLPVPEKTRNTTVLSGSFDFGMSGSLNASIAYEYYLNLYVVKKAEIALNMSRFEYSDNNPNPDLRLFSLLSQEFAEEVCSVPSASFNATQFFDEWGTDVITQAVFGGYNLYIYGRSENAYEETVGFDAMAELKRTKPSTEGHSWIDIYKNAHSDYAGTSFDVSYMNEDYSEASKSVSFTTTIGGNMTDNDASGWLEGFNSTSESDHWAIIGYRRTSEEPVEGATVVDSTSLLYPIETMAHNMVSAYFLNFLAEMTPQDIEAYSNAAENVNSLIEAKEQYLNDHAGQMDKTKSRLVIADIMMKYGDNGHKKGQPEPFVGTDPRNQTRKFIYYPVMANKHAPANSGYALETSQDEYTVAVDKYDEYWYYALAHEDECDGIVDIIFGKSKDYYTRRGDSSHESSNDTNTGNYILVKFFDSAVDSPSDKITAIGWYDKDDKKLIANTGGSELKRNPTESEENAWKAYWEDREERGDYLWNEGGIDIHYHKLYPVFVRKDLPVDRFNESTVCHPLKWGE